MRNLSLRHIETLQAIASAGSLVRAAAALHVTPAALTARVKSLEEAVALTLFDRTPAGMRLTKAGEAALHASARVMRAIRQFSDAMESIGSGEGGRLSVGATSTAQYFAPRLIAAFMAARPRIDLRFQVGNREATVEALRNDLVEVVLSGRAPRELSVEKHPIGPHPYILIAPPGHRLARAKGLRRANLEGEAFLFREIGSGTRAMFEDFIGETAIRRVQMGIELGSNETIKQAVIAGLGIALLSAHTVAAEIAEGRLVRLDVEGLPIVRQWYVLSRTDRILSPAALAFRDFAARHGAEFLPDYGGRAAADGQGLRTEQGAQSDRGKAAIDADR